MTTRRKILVAGSAGLCALAAPLLCFAQSSARPRRIGYLAARSRSTPANPDTYYDSFVQGMRELGYVEGKNLVIEWRFADGEYERLPALAAELVALKVEVIVSHATPGTKALQQATSSIPIVMTGIDPVASGFAASLARPGGNITGLSLITVDLGPKHVQLLKILLPRLSRVAFVLNSGNPGHADILKSFQTAARDTGLKVQAVDVRTPGDIERGFAAMVKERSEAFVIPSDSFFIGQRQQIVQGALKHRVPSLFNYREDVAAGGLMSYGQDLGDYYRRAATYVDKILKGARPGDLPIEQPTRLHLAINRRTARALGVAISQELLLRADEVIE